MTPFRIILFAADFSANSRDAFRVACSVADKRTSGLLVLHVVEPGWVAKAPEYLGQEETLAFETEGFQEFLQRRMREVYAPNVPLEVDYRVCEGQAAVEIIRAADKSSADLIAMGTHGRTGLSRLLTGSVAAAVLSQAHCPVLALRVDNRPHPVETLSAILCPTDFSPASEAALMVARTLARDFGARLKVLHVLPFDIYPEARFAAELDPWDSEHSLDAIRQRLDGPDLKYPVETQLSRGYEAEQIVGTAKELPSDLIVMGTHGRTGLSRLLMGSTAQSVLTKAECPVLVVKSTPDVPLSTPADSKLGLMATVF